MVWDSATCRAFFLTRKSCRAHVICRNIHSACAADRKTRVDWRGLSPFLKKQHFLRVWEREEEGRREEEGEGGRGRVCVGGWWCRRLSRNAVALQERTVNTAGHDPYGPVPVYRAPKNPTQTHRDAGETRPQDPQSTFTKKKNQTFVCGSAGLTQVHVSTVESQRNPIPVLLRRLKTQQVTAGYQRTKICPNPSVKSARRIRVHLPEEKWKSSSCLQGLSQDCQVQRGTLKYPNFHLRTVRGPHPQGSRSTGTWENV